MKLFVFICGLLVSICYRAESRVLMTPDAISENDPTINEVDQTPDADSSVEIKKIQTGIPTGIKLTKEDLMNAEIVVVNESDIEAIKDSLEPRDSAFKFAGTDESDEEEVVYVILDVDSAEGHPAVVTKLFD